MRVPLSWLREHVDWDISTAELADRLTLGGLEVTGIEHFGESWDKDKIRVGQVVAIRQHPNADRLVLVQVDYGESEPLEVVTGAPNLRIGESGQKVVFATVGAVLIDPYADTLKQKTLKKSKIRGVASAGMVCSEKELGISDEHTGIIILPDDAPVGKPLVDYWGDTVLDLDLTPNLARCFSLAGVARETAALIGATYAPRAPQIEATGDPIVGQVHIEIADPDLCPRYSAALIKGVRIAPSPQWMQRRLLLAGMRPINNIVDITNYVMLELGQPLHAFDYARVRSQEPGGPPTIIVRRARDGERMMTLDNVERALDSEMLLITDGGGPVAIAGIMGGLESEVEETTADVLLEAANFQFINVRRTSEALKIPSEAAQRFGRGVDPDLTVTALERAAGLMQEYASGTVAQGFADAYPNRREPIVIDFGTSEVKRLLGITLSADEVEAILIRLGFGCEQLSDAVVRVTVPSFRLDVSISADLVEEVARIYGYDRLPATLIDEQLTTQLRDADLMIEEQIRDILVGCGLTETITYSMTNLSSLAHLDPRGTAPDPEGLVQLANPLSQEHEFLRPTLMNTTLENVAKNLRFVDRVATFEVAHIYRAREEPGLPDESSSLSIALCGPKLVRSWLSNESPQYGFYDLKGIVETIANSLGIRDLRFARPDHPTFHPGRSANISIGDKVIGVIGEVHPEVASLFGLRERRVCLADLELAALIGAAEPIRPFRPLSPMPALKLDLALVIDEQVPADQVEKAIRESGGTLLTDVVLFDVYRGEQAGQGRKSLAYSLTFQSPNKTLKSEQANRQRDRIMKHLEKAFGATIRG